MSLDDLSLNLKDQPISQLFHRTVQSMETCLLNIRNTNSFMLMTINRCIDYTKASKGLKLVPRYETIDLMESLQLPLHCMQHLQNRIQIKLQEKPAKVCSHIITDRQWLQENVLCLLSNAVKYSNHGVVTVSMSLMKDTKSFKKSKLSVQSSTSNELESGSTSPTRVSRMKVYPIAYPTSSQDEDCDPSLTTNISLQQFELDYTSPKTSVSSKYLTSADTINKQYYLLIEVEDMGIGMTEEAMAGLFNPFNQTQRLAGGTGLGLYSLAKRVEALHGEYGVRPRRDGKQGSLFWFTIPYKPDDSVATMTQSSISSNNRPSYNYDDEESDTVIECIELTDAISSHTSAYNNPSLNSNFSSNSNSKKETNKVLKILLVDDSPTILKMTTMMLKRLGHETTIAENGEVAVRLVEQLWTQQESTYDVILMDLQMPIMDGIEATRRIRRLQQHASPGHGNMTTSSSVCLMSPLPSQIIIGLSANSDHDTMEAAYAAGINHFMGKPFNIQTFQETLSKLKVI